MGDVVDLFTNGEGRHGRVLSLLDNCYGNSFWRLILFGSSNKIMINNLYTSFNSEDALVKLIDALVKLTCGVC